jgi:hypothetical protein
MYSEKSPSTSSLEESGDYSSVLDVPHSESDKIRRKNEEKNLAGLVDEGKKAKKLSLLNNNKNQTKKEFIKRKIKEKKNTKNLNKNKLQEENKIVNENASNEMKCDKCGKMIKKKNFYYHDAIVHEGSNINLTKKKRALNDYIKKKLKKFNIIYADIMKNAEKLGLDCYNYPKITHVEKIGYHIYKFRNTKEN